METILQINSYSKQFQVPGPKKNQFIKFEQKQLNHLDDLSIEYEFPDQNNQFTSEDDKERLKHIEEIKLDLNEYKQLLNEKTNLMKWDESDNKKTLKTHKGMYKDLFITRAEGVRKGTPQQFLELLRNVQYKYANDENINQIKLLKTYSEDTRLAYLVFNGKMGMSKRDVVLFEYDFKEPDGSIFFIQKSVQSELAPLNEKNVRANMKQFILKISPETQNTSKLQLVVHMDFGMSVPFMMKGFITETRGKLLDTFENKIQELEQNKK